MKPRGPFCVSGAGYLMAPSELVIRFTFLNDGKGETGMVTRLDEKVLRPDGHRCVAHLCQPGSVCAGQPNSSCRPRRRTSAASASAIMILTLRRLSASGH